MSTEALVLSDEQNNALAIAKALALAGIPIFIAPPNPRKPVGFDLPPKWEQTRPDPNVVDQWRPGWALCAVMGNGLDLIDVDPRNGGGLDQMNGTTPCSYGVQATPSGGMHSFIKSLGTNSHDNIYPGIDFKGGAPDGSGRGFAFLAPTVRKSKEDGQLKSYTWLKPPDLNAWMASRDTDETGKALADWVRQVKAGSGSSPSTRLSELQKSGAPQWWIDFMAQRDPSTRVAAERAINAKINDVETWDAANGSGFRTVLLTAAYTMGGYVGGEYLTEELARQKLSDAVTEIWEDGPDADDLLWIDQGLNDGSKDPFPVLTEEEELAWLTQGANGPDGAGTGEAGNPDGAPPWNIYHVIGGDWFDPDGEMTDQGYARSVLNRMYPALRYARDSGQWVVREEDRWTAMGEDLTGWSVSTLADLMPPGLTPVPKDFSERTEQHWQAHRRGVFQSTQGRNKIVTKIKDLAKGAPYTLEIAKLDIEPDIMWAGGIPWDLRKSGVVPVAVPPEVIDPRTPHLHTAPFAPDPLRETPLFDAYLAGVLPDPEVRAWALRVLSVALTGYSAAVLPILYGRERSGKTSLIQILIEVLGTYAHAANPKLLSAKDSGHDTIIYDLKGRRLSFIDEGPKRGYDVTERLKQLTGGGALSARPVNANPVTFRPTHTMVMTTNSEPALTDPGLRARIRLIPCDSPESIVRPLREALTDEMILHEGPGILAMLMREAAAWLSDQSSVNNENAPAGIQDYVQEIAVGQDPVREWVYNLTVPADPGTPGRVLYTAFAEWHQSNPIYKRSSVPSETSFGRTLTDMGHRLVKIEGRHYRPLSVMNGFTPPPMAGPVPTGVVKAPAPKPDGSVVSQGGFEEGFGRVNSEPSSEENTSSGPVFSTSQGGLEGFTLKQSDMINSTSTYGCIEAIEPETSDPYPPASEFSENNGGDQQVSELEGMPPQTLLTPESALCGLDLPDGYSPYNNLTAYQISVWAGARGITKTEARQELKDLKAKAKVQAREDAKRVKIAEASGLTHQLPAVCDRQGNVFHVSDAQAEEIVAAALRRTGGELTVDVETSGYPIGHEHYQLRTVQLGDQVASLVLDAQDDPQQDLILAMLSWASGLVAHSATADLSPLVYAGLISFEDAWTKMSDTVITAKLADPQTTGSDPGLKQVSAKVIGSSAVSPSADAARTKLFQVAGWLKETEVTTPIDRSGWAQVNSGSETMIRYAASDVLDTAKLATLLPDLPEVVLGRERAVQRLTARLPLVGVKLDYDHVRAMQDEHRPRKAHHGETVKAMTGGRIENPGSPKQIAETLTAMGVDLRNRDGKISAAKEMLEPLQFHPEVGPLVKEILAYRHHNTVLGTFLEPYAVLCSTGDGRARPTVYTLGTDTGRMSCVRPNLQQLPRQGGVRACIVADPGQLMVGADFSGVELRVAAALSQDQNLMRIIAEGRDIHAEVALQVWGADPELSAEAGKPTPRKEHRYVAKRMVFGRLYGGGAPTLAAQTGASLEAAHEVIKTLDAMTPTLAAWSTSIRNLVKQGYVQFPAYSGRVIHFDKDLPHKAPNFAIQGTARELLVDAMLRWSQTQWGQAILLPVHDELDVFVPEAEAQAATEMLVACMETEIGGVKIVADPSVPSRAWADSS